MYAEYSLNVRVQMRRVIEFSIETQYIDGVVFFCRALDSGPRMFDYYVKKGLLVDQRGCSVVSPRGEDVQSCVLSPSELERESGMERIHRVVGGSFFSGIYIISTAN